MKGIYQFLRQLWKAPKSIYRPKVRLWKSSFERLDSPSRLDRARGLGYKAKEGYIIVRARMKKGRRKRENPRKGRKPHSQGYYFTTKQSKQAILEKRAARKYPNMEVVNSYYAGESGTHKYYEVILVDPVKNKKWAGQRRRAFRGLTSAARRSRGLLK